MIFQEEFENEENKFKYISFSSDYFFFFVFTL